MLGELAGKLPKRDVDQGVTEPLLEEADAEGIARCSLSVVFDEACGAERPSCDRHGVRSSHEANGEGRRDLPATRKYLVSVHDSFPLVVYYSVTPTEIVVIAILHGARDPRTWKRRK